MMKTGTDHEGRNTCIDLLRSLSAIAVIVLHPFNQFDVADPSFLGCALDLFLLISAVLLGERYRNAAMPFKGFLVKRFVSLASVYYLVILIMCLCLYVRGIHYDPRILVLNLLFLNNIWHLYILPNCQYFWFLSLIALCYAFIFACSRLSFVRKMAANDMLMLTLFACAMLSGFVYRGRHLIDLFFYMLVFYRWRDLVAYFGRFKDWQFIALFVVMNGLFAVVYALFVGCNSGACAFYKNVMSGMIAISILLISNRYLKGASPSKIVAFLSAISFEIYMVQSPLILGDFQIVKVAGIPAALSISYTLLIVLVLSVLLHASATRIKTFALASLKL
jgi:peptidoglycan/LPS O-acetylase OafA/YrhL